ncbi:ATP-binding protein [Streptomyces sp. SBT349]|uniref:ATP-binding protein n=1 Tax=Streptomyces sp. SBT349 TaxID=1580539 RepID=UPI0018FE4889|nr:tetratricopeptide repeat protein [Streptomyces sp. SBT349]
MVQARDVRGGVHFHDRGRNRNPPPQQLPGDVHGFVGRAQELLRLDAMLSDDPGRPFETRIIAVTGTAGVGKTSLAVHWSHMIRGRFPDGQLYVNLRGYDPGLPVSPDQALDRFLRALHIHQSALPVDTEARSALLRSLLADRRMLVVLDNASTVRQVRPLLPGTAQCLAVVTSRNRLSGLVARDGARRLGLDMLPEEDAIRLLRVTTADYRDEDDPADLTELARLCARLPLALRIAAERAASRPRMPLSELIRDLRDESAQWDALSAENGEEADAVRSVFAWSFRAFPEEPARLFRLLGLHPGSEFGPAAAAALANTTVAHARQLLDALVGAHTLEQIQHDRYQFHDLLRAYATQQARHEETEEDRREALRRVLEWYLHTAGRATAAASLIHRRVQLDEPVPGVQPLDFQDRADATRWYARERQNLSEATALAASLGFHRLAWQLPAVLRGFFVQQNPFEDWFATSRTGLESARQLGDRHGEAELLASLGQASRQSHRLADAVAYQTRALEIWREIGDTLGAAISANGLGLIFQRTRDLTRAREHYEQSAAAFEELGDEQYAAIVRSNLGATCLDAGLLDEAETCLEQALAVLRAGGNRVYEAYTLGRQSRLQRERGRPAEARESAESMMEVARDLENQVLEGQACIQLGHSQRMVGDHGQALISFQRSATLHRQLGDENREALALSGAGEAFQDLGRLDEAVDFLRRAAAAHRKLGDAWQLALALDRLAVAVEGTGAVGQAREYWREARDLLGGFGDRKAAALLDRVTAALG